MTTARTTGLALTGVAVLSALASVVLGLLPNRGTAVEYTLEPETVNCGTPLVDTGYDGDEGCEGKYLSRMGWMVLCWLVALPLGAVGLFLLFWSKRRS